MSVTSDRSSNDTSSNSLQQPTPVAAYRWNPYHNATNSPNKSSVHHEQVPRRYFPESARISTSAPTTPLQAMTTPPQGAQMNLCVFAASNILPSAVNSSSGESDSEGGHSTPSDLTVPPCVLPTEILSPAAESAQGTHPDTIFSRRSSAHTSVSSGSTNSFRKVPSALHSPAPVQLPAQQGSAHAPAPVNQALSSTAKYYAEASGSDIVRVLRGQPSDSSITNQVKLLSENALERVFDFLLSSPDTISSLCKNDRGNVVVHLFGIHSFFSVNIKITSHLDSLFQAVMHQFTDLMVDKLGALALTRLYDIVPQQSHYRHTLDRLTLGYFEQLVSHPYGNFLVSQILKNVSSALPETKSAISGIYCKNGGRFLNICMDKFGSHTAEVWAQYAPLDQFQETMETLLHDMNRVTLLANSLTGNNPLQHLLQRLHSSGVGCDPKQVTAANDSLVSLWRQNRRGIASAAKNCAFEKMVLGALNGRTRPRGKQQH